MADAEELLDVLDEAGRPTGETKPRSGVHRDGDWHRVFHLWVVREGRLVLFQRRSRHKDVEPGRIDVSVGGHLRAGEATLQGVREAREEIGLEVELAGLVQLGTWRSERRYQDLLDREVQEVFAVRCEQPLEAYAPDCAEVYVLYEVPLERALQLYVAGEHVAAAGFDCQGRANNALLIADDLIGQARGTTAEQLRALAAWLQGGT